VTDTVLKALCWLLIVAALMLVPAVAGYMIGGHATTAWATAGAAYAMLVVFGLVLRERR
jgi:hypothetical protein